MAIESSLRNMVIVLFAVCLVASAALGGIYTLTKEPIEAAQVAKTNSAIAAVVPEFDNNPSDAANVMEVEVNGTVARVYTAKMGEEVVGYAIEASTSKGFSGNITVMVGFTPDGTIINTSVISHAETPGLGAKCVEPEFRDQFKDFDPAVKKLSVTKDGGDVNAITASTITSRAFCNALGSAVKAFNAITGASVPVDSASGATAAGNEENADESGDTK